MRAVYVDTVEGEASKSSSCLGEFLEGSGGKVRVLDFSFKSAANVSDAPITSVTEATNLVGVADDCTSIIWAVVGLSSS